jgi:hypothetical protein
MMRPYFQKSDNTAPDKTFQTISRVPDAAMSPVESEWLGYKDLCGSVCASGQLKNFSNPACSP